MVSSGNSIDTFLQAPGKDGHYTGDKRFQFPQAIAGCQHNDDRNRQVIYILLIRDTLVDGNKGIELFSRSQTKQAAVVSPRPPHLLHRARHE